MNSDIATRKTVRMWNRRITKLLAGMSTARVSRKPVVTHCPALGVIPKSSISVGSATPRSSSLRKTMNVETIRIPMTRATPGGSLSLEEAAGAGSSDVDGNAMCVLAVS
jgi:hypothetical protein